MKFQLKPEITALFSLVIAFSALTYNTWRNELTEHNRNVRLASFEILKELAALQLIADHAYYNHDTGRGNSITGWGHVGLIQDLSAVLPDAAQQTNKALKNTWQENWSTVHTSKESNRLITEAIVTAREGVLLTLSQLR